MQVETDFEARRKNLIDQLDGGLAVIRSNPSMTRSNDTHYPYRQSTDLKYLTGFNEPDSTLVLFQRDGEYKSAFFVLPKKFEIEIWTGKRMGVEKTKEIFGFDEVYPIEEFETKLPELLDGHKSIYLNLFDQDFVTKTISSINRIPGGRKKKSHRPSSIHDITPLIGKQKLIKDPTEIIRMKKSAELAAHAFSAAMKRATPGVGEGDLQSIIEYVYKLKGNTVPAYDTIVAGGSNAIYLHYVENNDKLKDGDLVLIDSGAEVDHYASDVTRTFPINGKYTEAQKDIYQIVLNAQKNAIAMTKPGETLPNIHRETGKSMLEGLLELGILKGTLEDHLEKNTIRKYFPHGTGHWLGADVHDVCPYLEDDLSDVKLAAGMVFTIEPGLYFREDDTDIPEKYRGIGVRIEDDILVTEVSHENLTSMIPKEISEVEKACQQDFASFLASLH